jgi:hypothetical protein
MKCYYIVIEYLPGYSGAKTFLKCAEKAPELNHEYPDTQKLLEIVVDYHAII